jgi:hypothetical protein
MKDKDLLLLFSVRFHRAFGMVFTFPFSPFACHFYWTTKNENSKPADNFWGLFALNFQREKCKGKY